MKDDKIELADHADAEAIFALYHSLIDMPGGTWDEEYPSKEIVEHDLAHHDVLVMRDVYGKIISAIVVEPMEDELAETEADWYTDVQRWAELSRLGVDKSMQGKGIAKKMLLAAMDFCRERGYEAVRFLVSKSNPAPQRAYAKLNFDVCGEAYLYEHHWLCYQKRL